MQGYRFFCNKLWNAVKFALTYLTGEINASGDVSVLYQQVVRKLGGGEDVRTLLNVYLGDHSYIDGYTMSETDRVVYNVVSAMGWDRVKLPHLDRWVNHIKALQQSRAHCCKTDLSVRSLSLLLA